MLIFSFTSLHSRAPPRRRPLLLPPRRPHPDRPEQRSSEGGALLVAGRPGRGGGGRPRGGGGRLRAGLAGQVRLQGVEGRAAQGVFGLPRLEAVPRPDRSHNVDTVAEEEEQYFRLIFGVCKISPSTVFTSKEEKKESFVPMYLPRLFDREEKRQWARLK